MSRQSRVSLVIACLAVMTAAGCSKTGADAPSGTTSPSAVVSSALVPVNLKLELEAFIAKRGADQGKAAGAMMITSGIRSVDKNGTEYVIVAEYEGILVAAGIADQLAYMVGKYDEKATTVTVKTPGGQELFSGPPPAVSIAPTE